MKSTVTVYSLCLILAAVPAGGTDCDGWNTEEFFKTATVEEVTGCLQSGADPLSGDENGNTPLHWAAGRNETPAVITALLNAGANPNERKKSGSTPLHWAARSNENPAVIATLLNAGANPNARNNYNGNTPLHEAASRNKLPGALAALQDNMGDYATD